MVVRIKLQSGAWPVRLHAAWLLHLAACACLAMGVWLILAGLRWMGAFFIERGVFSHWQVWVAGGLFAQLAAFRLKRPSHRQQRELLS